MSMKRILPHIMSISQKGFLKDRCIGENIDLVYDIINILKREEKDLLY